MPQLDFLIFFNEMFYTLVGFIIFYILLYRLVITKLAYNLKLRAKLKNKMDLGDTLKVSKIFEGTKTFTQYEILKSYLDYTKYREQNLINEVKLDIKNNIKKK